MVESLGDRHLLWVDVDGRDAATLDRIAALFDLDSLTARWLREEHGRARLLRHDRYVHLTLQAVEVDDDGFAQREIDLIAGRNFVVTVHRGEIAAFESFLREVRGETRLGALDAAAFMAALVDTQLSSYFAVVEEVEREIDRLDERALRGHAWDQALLGDLVALRRRVANLRRALAPHREAFAPLARPDFELHEELGSPWPGLNDRLERTIESVENARELLVGSFDIHLGRIAQHTNDVMKALAIVSSLLLPSAVLAGIMGMNFRMPFFEDTSNFWFVIVVMLAFAFGLLIVARFRRWV